MSTLSRVKTIKLSLWYQESVRNSAIARVRNSGSHFQSNPYSFYRGSGIWGLLKRRSKNEDLRPKTPWTKTKTLWTKTKTPWTKTKTPWTKTKTPWTKTKTPWTKTKTLWTKTKTSWTKRKTSWTKTTDANR